MVSFQCHKCSDVVKKPKLNQHHSFCHAPFDCIDCSTTFHSPTEYQGHISCMTEAEKYEKSLYKGPKLGGGRGAAPRQSWRGGYQGHGGYHGRQLRYEATGANVTPLGTPQRMSPVTTPPEPERPAVPIKPIEDQPLKDSAPESDEIKEKKKSKSKSKNKGKKMLEDTLVIEASPVPSSPKVEKKDKKHKKSTERRANPVECAVGLNTPVPAEISGENRKKYKKAEKSDTVAAETLGGQTVGDEDDESLSKSKKRKRENEVVDVSAGGENMKDKKKRREEAKGKEKVDETLPHERAEKTKSKKRRTDKSEAPSEHTTDVKSIPSGILSLAPAEKKKKHKKPVTDQVEASPVDVGGGPDAKVEKKTKKDR